MFTGIIEEIGKVKNMVVHSNAIELTLTCNLIRSDLKLGDSVCVNGVCLTASSLHPDGFTAQIMPETVNKTTLRLLKPQSAVNLERALTLNTRIGGHMVTGHIDGVGMLLSIEHDSNAIWLEIGCSDEMMRLMVLKGSVALEGTSLTIARITDKSFTVSLIPHTQMMSIVSKKKMGDLLNIECDIIGKYIERFFLLANKPEVHPLKSAVDMHFLKENGFL